MTVPTIPLTSDELATLTKDEPVPDQIAARVAYRHMQAMSDLGEFSREMFRLIGRVHIESIAGESLEDALS